MRRPSSTRSPRDAVNRRPRVARPHARERASAVGALGDGSRAAVRLPPRGGDAGEQRVSHRDVERRRRRGPTSSRSSPICSGMSRTGQLIVLLQEVVSRLRGGPVTLLPDAAFAGRLGPAFARAARRAGHIETISKRSRRRPAATPTTSRRCGTARRRNPTKIAATPSSSNVPLAELTRSSCRSSVSAASQWRRRVSGRTPDGTPWRCAWSRRTSTTWSDHAGCGSPAAGFARARQARALVDYLPRYRAGRLGGDFNTWFGFRTARIAETARAFRTPTRPTARATFHGLLRLDHSSSAFPLVGVRRSSERGRHATGPTTGR